MAWLMVFLGGGLGSMLRYFTGKLTHSFFQSNLPLGTMAANLFSCLILGVFLFLFREKLSSTSTAHLFLVTGLCGGYSTFSTFSLESLKLFQEGMAIYAILNIVLSIILCILVLYMFLR